MSKKVAKDSQSSGSASTMYGPAIISSIIVIAACSFGIWLVNSVLMKEITILQEGLSETSRQLGLAESQIVSVPVLQTKLDSALQQLKSAESELEKLRLEVAKPTLKVNWNQLPSNLTNDVVSIQTKVKSLDNVNNMLTATNQQITDISRSVQTLQEQVNGATKNVEHLEKCFHCPCDFDRIVDSCYFIQRNKLFLSYDDAAKICASKNATLVNINTVGEFHVIRNFLINIYQSGLYDTEHGWLTDARRVDGVLSWRSTGKPFVNEAVVWGENEPSNEECVTFFPTLGRNMNLADLSCSAINRQFICEL